MISWATGSTSPPSGSVKGARCCKHYRPSPPLLNVMQFVVPCLRRDLVSPAAGGTTNKHSLTQWLTFEAGGSLYRRKLHLGEMLPGILVIYHW